MNHLHLTGPLGEQISVEFTNDDHRLRLMREWGARGFSSGTVPAGGYVLPYSMADTFDWAMIGARKWTTPEGETTIRHRGHTYKIRHMEAVDSKKLTLPACVKVSRGAKPSDPEHIREKSDGEIEYVTLAVFRGGGKALPEYEQPRQAQRPTRAPEAPQEAEQEPAGEEAPPIGPERGKTLSSRCADALKDTKYSKELPVAIARRVFHWPELRGLGELTEAQGMDLLAMCQTEQRKAQPPAA